MRPKHAPESKFDVEASPFENANASSVQAKQLRLFANAENKQNE
jgi:hypothetical protein